MVVFVGVYVTVTTAVAVGVGATVDNVDAAASGAAVTVVTAGAADFRVPPTAPPTITPMARRLAMTPKTIQNTLCGIPQIVIRVADLLFSGGIVIGTSDPEPVNGGSLPSLAPEISSIQSAIFGDKYAVYAGF